MGKSLKGRELGEGITQRACDGLYIGRYIDRWGKRRTVSSMKLSECKKKREEAIELDRKGMNVVDDKITVQEWFEIWMDKYKSHCRSNTKDTYARHYKRIAGKIGQIRLSQLTSLQVQDALNDLSSDNQRMNSRKILSDMLEKAYESDLVVKNVAKNTNIKGKKKCDQNGNFEEDEKKEIKTLNKEEEKTFLKYATGRYYYNLFVVALQTGMRIGEITGLTWDDIDFDKRKIYVRKSLTYFQKNGKYVFEIHPTKTKSGRREIDMTESCYLALQNQRIQKNKIIDNGKTPKDGFENLVFVTRNNKPTQEFLVVESMQAIIKRITKDGIKMDSFAPHTFRHTFATNALDSGMKPKVLQKILGHKTLQMTMDIYCSVPEDTLSNEMKLFEDQHNIVVGIGG